MAYVSMGAIFVVILAGSVQSGEVLMLLTGRSTGNLEQPSHAKLRETLKFLRENGNNQVAFGVSVKLSNFLNFGNLNCHLK